MRLLLSCCLVLLFSACSLISSNTVTDAGPSKEKKISDTYLQAGTLALQNGNYTDALRSLLDAVKYDPNSVDAWNNLGLAYYGKQQPVLARESWEKALKLNPKYSDARSNLGSMHLQLGQYDKAEKEFKTVLQDLVYDKLHQVHFNMAILYMRKNQWLQAEQSLRLAVQDNSNFCAAWSQLGQLYQRKGDSPAALDAYQNSIRGSCYAAMPEAHYEIAQLYLKQRDLPNAELKLRELVERFPKTEWALKAQDNLSSIRQQKDTL